MIGYYMIKGHATWDHQTIYRIWVYALINKISPFLASMATCELGITRVIVSVSLVVVVADTLIQAPAAKNAFNSGILWDGKCSCGGVQSNLSCGSCDHECKVTEHCVWIIRLLWLSISLGCGSLQGSVVFSLLPPVLVIIIRLELYPHPLLPACIPKNLR